MYNDRKVHIEKLKWRIQYNIRKLFLKVYDVIKRT